METLGEWLRKTRRARGWAQIDLAKAAEVTVDTISRTERGRNIPELRTMRRLAEALGVDFAVVEPKLNELQVAFEKGAAASLEIQKATAELQRRWDEEDLHVYGNRIEWIGPVPLFELSLAAGMWTDVSQVEGVFEPSSAGELLFRIRLAGDSMEPTYQHGQVVVFQRVNVRPEELPLERDYYVQRDNGLATFKRLEKVTKTTLVLRPLNAEKYPQALTVERADLRAMAIAVAKEPLGERVTHHERAG